jgi:hypothetical protein
MSEDAAASSAPAANVIELTVKSITELFDSSTPACLGYQTVNGAITELLLEKVAAAPRNVPDKLNLIVPAGEIAQAATVATAMRAYFEVCREQEQRRISRIFWEARVALSMSVVFLLVANALGQGIRAAFSGKFAGAVATGLEIFGWVAMWKPAELLLYDWIPVRRRRNLLARLASMEIECVPGK